MKNNSVQGKTDNTKDKAQENHVKMTQTPVPSLILRLSCSTVVSMLAGTTYNIVDMYFVSDLGNSAVAAVGVLFSVLAMIQAVGYTFGMGAGSRISRFLGEQKEQEAGRDALVAVLMSLIAGLILMGAGFLWQKPLVDFLGSTDTIETFALEINFSDPEFTISADLSLLGSEKAKAAAKINKDGLDVSASVELGISGFGCEVNGSADANLGGNLTGGYIKLGVNGNVDMAPANVHAKGASKLAVDWDWDFNKAKVTLNYSGNNGKEKEASIWYEDNGELFLWDKVHASSN